MSKSFITYLVESQSIDTMLQRMADQLEIVDKGQDNTFIVRDKKLGDLTGDEHIFEVRLHDDNDVAVHPYNDHDHARAAEIERNLVESAPLNEASDAKRAAIAAQIKQGMQNQKGWDTKAAGQVNKRMTDKYGKDWKKKSKEASQAAHDANNDKVRNSRQKPLKDTPANRAQADAYVGRKKGTTRTTD